MHLQSETIGELAKALAQAQGEMHAASKDATNPHFKNRYADLASVWDACRAPLARHGLSVSQLPSRREDGSVLLTTLLMHSSGEFIGSYLSARPAQENPQVIGSILTYLRRYALASIVGVVSGEDDDAEAATAPTRKATPEPARPSQHAAPTSTPAAPPARLVEASERVARGMGAEVEGYTRSTQCPVCMGDMWDNRDGKKNPKAPDFKCKKRDCEGVIWKYKAPPAPSPIPGGFLEQDAQLPPDEIPF
jgi:hypothetical protein